MVTTKFNLKRNAEKLKSNSFVSLCPLLCAVFAQQAQAQTKISGAAGTVNASAYLQLGDSLTAKGFLQPRVKLISTIDNATIANPATGLHVYNVNTQNDVTPGEYYWNGSIWVRLVAGSDALKVAWNVANTTTPATSATQNIYQNGMVGIGNFGSSTPATALDIENGTTGGAIKIADGTQGAGKVLTSDANGVGTWQTQDTILAGADGVDPAPTSVTVKQQYTGINNAGAAASALAATKSFTLTRRSLVTISYTLVASNIMTYAGGNLTDGAAKVLGAAASLNGSGINTLNINVSIPYTNSSTTGTATGAFYLSGGRTIALNPGTYTVELSGWVYVNDSIGISATFGDDDADQLDIIAFPM